jgi:uncharacterized membrane protein YphA (DoxX/SURF4 family)
MILLQAHSGLRWLVVLVTVIAIVWMLVGMVQQRTYDALAKRVMLFFSILISLQWLLGIVLFLLSGGFDISYRWVHALMMTVAVAMAHMHQRWKNSPDSVRYRNSLLVVIAVLILVAIGIQVLPQGWAMTRPV